MTFAWMILRASWKPARVRYKGKPISLNRGQLATSVRDLADAMDRDKAWIERLFKRLKSETMIETHTDTGVTVVTICNYAEYQSDGDTTETIHETASETDARQTRDTEQEDKEFKKEPKGSSRETRARGAFVCPDGVGLQHWTDFLTNRKRRRLSNTPTAYEGIIQALRQMSDEEWPPGRLVELAASKGWGSIVDPREAGYRNGTNQSTLPTNLRGSRPSPALALTRLAEAEIAAERAAVGQESDRGAWATLPAFGPS